MTTTLLIEDTYFECGNGKFKSSNRYLRAGASGSRFPIVKGETCVFVSSGTFTVRYSVNGYVQQGAGTGTFNATFTLVTT